MNKEFDYSALTDHITFGEAKREQVKVNDRWKLIVGVLIVFIGLTLFGFFRRWNDGDFDSSALGVVGLFLVMIAVTYFIYTRQVIKAAKLKRFATQNGLEYITDARPVERDTLFFGRGDVRSVLFGLHDTTTSTEIAQYRYRTGFNYSARIWQYTYMSVPAEGLPSVYVHSKRNSANHRSTYDYVRDVTKLPESPQGIDFDSKFTVYSNEGDSIKLPETLRHWMIENQDFDYILGGGSAIAFRRGYMRFTRAEDMKKILKFTSVFRAIVGGEPAADQGHVEVPKPAIHAGNIRTGLYWLIGVAFIVMLVRLGLLVNPN